MDNSNVNTSVPVSAQGGTKKNLSALTIIFAITTLGFGGAFAWAMLRDNGGISADKGGNSNTCAVTQEEVEKAEEGTVGEIVANYDTDKEVKDLIKDIIKYYGRPETGVVSPNTMTIDSGAVVTKLDSGVLTITTKSYGVTVTPANFDLVYNYANTTKEYFAANGFTLNNEFSGDNIFVYDKGDIRCRFNEGVSPFGMVCSNVKWVNADSAELANAMYNAYAAKNGSVDSTYVFFGNKEKITTSNSGKYERFQGTISRSNTGIGSGYALYYREVGATEWTFVLAGNGIPMCSSFDEAATEAFTGSGFGCIDDNNNAKLVGE